MPPPTNKRPAPTALPPLRKAPMERKERASLPSNPRSDPIIVLLSDSNSAQPATTRTSPTRARSLIRHSPESAAQMSRNKCPISSTDSSTKESGLAVPIPSLGKRQDLSMEEKARHVCKYGHRMRKEDREDAKLVVKRVKDAASIFLRSQGTVRIIVDRDNLQRTFCIHKKLLAKHSQYFENVFIAEVAAPPTLPIIIKVEGGKPPEQAAYPLAPSEYALPHVSAVAFVHFMSWLYTGSIDSSLAETHSRFSDQCSDWTTIWAAGSQLTSPGLQNYALHGLRKQLNVREGRWPTADQVSKIYDQDVDILGTKNKVGGDNKLKDFVVACIATNQPYKKTGSIDNDGAQRESWIQLFENHKELGVKVLLSDGKDWTGEGPWDTKFRSKFELEDETLSEASPDSEP